MRQRAAKQVTNDVFHLWIAWVTRANVVSGTFDESADPSVPCDLGNDAGGADNALVRVRTMLCKNVCRRLAQRVES